MPQSQEFLSTPSLPLTGRIALVTGASRGIGRAVALHLGRLGAQLLLIGRDQQALVQVAQELAKLGATAEAMPCDLSSDSDIEALAGPIDAAGGCDILINAAGIGKIGKPLDAMPVEDFDAVLATNLRAPFLLMRLVVPLMKKRGGGHIINISSLAGKARFLTARHMQHQSGRSMASRIRRPKSCVQTTSASRWSRRGR